ncbi:MAG TPA: hypothetical protein VHH94_00470 [Gammaproteobacteria bacterium]|nr:hypothetical protein [Gammaproteobacteria bacterium]
MSVAWHRISIQALIRNRCAPQAPSPPHLVFGLHARKTPVRTRSSVRSVAYGTTGVEWRARRRSSDA